MPRCCVMAWRIMFGKIIHFVGFSWVPVNKEVSLDFLIIYPMEYHVQYFVFFFTLELMMPKAVWLSFFIGIGGC